MSMNDKIKAMKLEWQQTVAIERRQVLQVLASAAAAAVLPRQAFAATGELVLCNWGGASEKAIRAAFTDAVLKVTGKTLAVDGSGPEAGKIKAMVEAKHVIWDVADLDLGNLRCLAPRAWSKRWTTASSTRSRCCPI